MMRSLCRINIFSASILRDTASHQINDSRASQNRDQRVDRMPEARVAEGQQTNYQYADNRRRYQPESAAHTLRSPEMDNANQRERRQRQIDPIISPKRERAEENGDLSRRQPQDMSRLMNQLMYRFSGINARFCNLAGAIVLRVFFPEVFALFGILLHPLPGPRASSPGVVSAPHLLRPLG